MRRSLSLLLFAVAVGSNLSGCGSGSNPTGGDTGGANQTFGPFVTRVVGTAQPPVTYSTNSVSLTGVAGANISSLVLNDSSLTLAETKIAFTQGFGSGDEQLSLMNPDGSEKTLLTNDKTLRYFDVSISPDGSQLVYSSQRAGDLEIYRSNIDGTGEVQLTNALSYSDAPRWSPDGSKIVFFSGRTGGDDIYVMNADGTNQTRLTSDASSERDPSWSPDGSQILFTRTGNIFIMSANGTNQRSFGSTPVAGANPVFSPDGGRVVFSTFSDTDVTNPEIHVMNYLGFQNTRLTTDTTTSDSYDYHCSWSPDGSKIIWESGAEIWTMNPDGSGKVKIAGKSQPSDFAYNPSWGPLVSHRNFIGLGGSMGTNAAGFLFCRRGTQTTSLVTFDATTRASVRLIAPTGPGTSPPNVVFTVTAGDSLTALSFANDLYLKSVNVIGPSGDVPNASGALVDISNSTGEVTSVLPYTANRSGAPTVTHENGQTIVRGQLLGVWDASGKNLAKRGATEVRLDTATGRPAVIR